MSAVVHLPRIHQLSIEVANQIAAGEVIERPASVVKELVENSIDAAATRIQIDIVKAGISQIKIQDDGQGIHKDDLKLALMPHATSKLSRFSDLSQIASLGFRGEALPSIASVSQFTLTSRMQDMEQAWSIDNRLALKPAAHPFGTTVNVQDLFHATPARRKFLKSDRTEFLHIQSLLKAIALSHFSIGFRLNNDGKSLLNYVACEQEPERRVMDVCGKAFVNKSLFIDAERDGMQLWGWLGSNDLARSQSDRQYFFVNGRIVQDKHVNHAIRLVCADRIDSGRFPSYALYLQLDPARVDINVHPAKSEVRFAEPRDIHDFIYAGLLSGFSQTPKQYIYEQPRDAIDRDSQRSLNEHAEFYRQNKAVQPDLLRQQDTDSRYLLLANGQFVIAEFLSEQLLIDIEKTRELLTASAMAQAYRDNAVRKRPILVPVSCGLNAKQLERLGHHHEQLLQWGFEIEQIAPSQVAVRAIPEQLLYADTVSLVRDFLNNLQDHDDVEQLATALARHVNDAGRSVSDDEINDLILRIKSYEQHVGDVKNLPWRRLDADSLTVLLENSR